MQLGLYTVFPEVRGRGAYGSIFEGHLTGHPEVRLAFKALRGDNAAGLMGRVLGNDAYALAELSYSIMMRPDANAESDSHMSVFVDLPVLPIFDVVDGEGIIIDGEEPPYLKVLQQSLFLVTPFYDYDLHRLIRQGALTHLSLEGVLAVIYSLLRAVAIFHSIGWSHRDIKPDNVLVNKYGQLCLCDFGMARFEAPFYGRFGVRDEYDFLKLSVSTLMTPLPQDKASDWGFQIEEKEITEKDLITGYTTFCGTLWWRGPDQCLGLNRSMSGAVNDAWALGCTLCNILFDRSPFQTQVIEDIYGTGEMMARINHVKPFFECKKYHRGFIDTSEVMMRPRLMSGFKERAQEQCDEEAWLYIRTIYYKCSQQAGMQHGMNSLLARLPSLIPEVAERHRLSHERQYARVLWRNRRIFVSPHTNSKLYYSFCPYNLSEALLLGLIIRFGSQDGLRLLRDDVDMQKEEMRTILTYPDLLRTLSLTEGQVLSFIHLAHMMDRLLALDPSERALPADLLSLPLFSAIDKVVPPSIPLPPDGPLTSSHVCPFTTRAILAIHNPPLDLASHDLPSIVEQVRIPLLRNFVWEMCGWPP
ncbi:Kinase, CMGC CMGC-GL1 [Giardia muris]|uniref:Kinase, CMGC CMGC-GL1 n=1 Tax=Giardia muris TaxID=5742 RepID=A0A4Z1SPX0_GIAMU|nr:Kinase, CMGC CMGC-GL1 [Giardia muris]|eukprot:TNJ27882.1 Kinase, CMGC CMGC-GL1 [Giardia muris]